jgi:hypothetical protein
VRFQGPQATVRQFAGTIASILVWACWRCFYTLSFTPVLRDPRASEHAPPPLFWISLLSVAIPLSLTVVWWVYRRWRSVRGHEFQYIGLGPALKGHTLTA